MKYFKI